MRPYSEDLRKRIIEARERGESAEDLSRRYNLSKRSVERYWSRYQSSGSYQSYKKGKPSGSVLDGHRERLLKWIEKEPRLTLEQLRERLAAEADVKVSVVSIWKQLKRYGLSFKKNDMRKRAKP